MKQEDRISLQKNLKKGHVICEFLYKKKGSLSEAGYPIFTLEYVCPPGNYKLVSIIYAYQCAILEDLDYAK